MERSGRTKSTWPIRCPAHFVRRPRPRSRPRAGRRDRARRDPFPARTTARRSVSSSANRQVRNCPSAVTRTRSQLSQNGSRHACDHADVADPVAEPEALGRLDVVGIARLEREHGVDAFDDLVRRHDLVADSTPLRVEGHELDEATPTPFSRPNCARSTTSSSLIPRMTTALILTGASPARSAASTPASTRSSSSRLVNAKKRSRCSESSEMLIRLRPGRREIVRELGKPHTVRRHRDVDAERREHLHETRHVRAHERFAAGDADRLEAVALDADAGRSERSPRR